MIHGIMNRKLKIKLLMEMITKYLIINQAQTKLSIEMATPIRKRQVVESFLILMIDHHLLVTCG